MTLKTLNTKTIRIDGGTQSRVRIDNDVVADYAEAIKAGDKMPPVIVFFDGADNWLADGFHRWHGNNAALKSSIVADVFEGTQRDAILFSLGANKEHGLRPSNEDKRNSVARMLADPEWSLLSDREIARHCGCAHPLVGQMRNPKPEKAKAPAPGTGSSTTPPAQDKPASAAPAPAPRGSSTTPPPPTEKEMQAAQAAEDAHGETDLIVELEAAHKDIEALQAQIKAASAEDPKAEAMKWQRIAAVAQQRQHELMATVNDRELALSRVTKALRRCGTAVGEDDPTKVAAAVEAMARSVRVPA